ncbi:hypothetical protein RDWZM_008543 [Blomia tropicalis]|uniref:Sodium/potassium-transporting ATPase subunit alpha n=1 Tax=Blomia tropicalis TaxID=40697 RepID=A0A9Q0RK66_BLOTA|nr:hypothetical protein RDWZM_008543 [Blomia tropicalis]
MIKSLWKKANERSRIPINVDHLKKESDTDEHLIPIDDLYARLQTDDKKGLNSLEVNKRRRQYGPNRLTPPLTIPLWVILLEHMFEGIATLLWAGSFLCMFAYLLDSRTADNLYLGFILLIVVLFTGIFSFTQETKSSAIMDSFNKLIPQSATVIRDGIKSEINSEQIVVGDIVEIKAALTCKVDNSSLTGESEPQIRVPNESEKVYIASRNMAFFSTNCVEGWCKGVVVSTGDSTAIGRIACLTGNLEHVQSPIALEIQHFIHFVTMFAIFIAIVFMSLSLISGTTIIESVVFFISIIVANVPEGLMATLTVCLTLSAKTMARKNCLVKNLQSVETLGETSTICSDKTGTLTQNRMTVAHLWVSNNVIEAADVDPAELPINSIQTSTTFDTAKLICCLCSKAVFRPNQSHLHISQRLTIGDASESAILKFIESITMNLSVENVREMIPLISEIPFNSSNKFHLTIHQFNQKESHYLICMKGAPERILERCSTYRLDDGEHPIEDTFTKLYEKAYESLGGLGERVIGMCWKILPKTEFPLGYGFDVEKTNFPTNNFQFIGLISMVDPPRPNVRLAVNKCRDAGIKVIMVTGDHPITAKAIANTVDIILSGNDTYEPAESAKTSEITSQKGFKSIVLTGTQITELGNDGLDQVIEIYNEIVFARTSPQQKMLIVEAFQRKGEIVAVTGDGVNDSPALKTADIGISMGITGSDVSKQAADMILLDDNFASIVVGIEEGRVIFDNLKKSIAYTLTSNTPEMLPFLLFLTLGIPLPLGMITILCIDLGTDIMPAISLAYEPAESDIMKRKPRDKKDRLINGRMIQVAYFQIGVIQFFAGFTTYIVVMAEHGFFWNEIYHSREVWNSETTTMSDHFGQEWSFGARKRLEFTCQTAFFATIVATQWFDLLVCKTRRNSILQQGMRNDVLNFSLIAETSMTIFLCYCPGMTKLKLYPLKWNWWLYGIPYGIYLFLYDEMRRYQIRTIQDGFFQQETYY